MASVINLHCTKYLTQTSLTTKAAHYNILKERFKRIEIRCNTDDNKHPITLDEFTYAYATVKSRSITWSAPDKKVTVNN